MRRETRRGRATTSPGRRLGGVMLFVQTLVVIFLAMTYAKGGWHREQERNSHISPHHSVAEACPRHYVSLAKASLDCPSSQGVVLLPANYPPRTIFVGYVSEPRYLSFLKTIIERNNNRKNPFKIVVLIPRLDIEQAYNDLKPFMKHPKSDRITFLATPSDETLWTQDYLEVGISMPDGEAKIIDLPYTDREGEFIPASLALSCQLDLVPQANGEGQGEIPESGDYGGNIEALPGNILLVGNTMTTATSQRLQETLRGMVAFEVKVDWLLAGHVDEIFAVLPDATSRAACPFAVAYASPQLALSLIQQHGLRPGRDRLMPQDIFLEDVSPELKEGEFFSQCLGDYAQRRQLSRRCQRLIDANVYYDKLIEQERQRVNTILIKRNACASINWIALPQLFVPSLSVWRSGSQWGTEADLAQAINPNAVSVIALGEDLIMPQQPYPPFAREIDQRLRPLGLSLIGVDATYAHFLNGGLHCLASVVRTCRRKTIASSRVGDGRH